MSKFVDRPRYTCALGGALSAIRAIPRAIPIIHAASGCGYNLYNAINGGAGYLGGGYCGGASLPSTNVMEREVVFGGENRLREQIKNTLELIDGDLYVVVSGCMVEMIGDDIESVAHEFEDASVIAIPTPSFSGNSYHGYDLILKGLARHYVEPVDKRDKKVNILGIVPGMDVFYKGNLKEIKRVLKRIGIEANTLFGEEETLLDIRHSSDASLTVVLSDLYGIEAAKEYQSRFQIPYITTPFPVGFFQTSEFLREIGRYFGVDESLVEGVILSEGEIYYDYFERTIDIYNDVDMQRYTLVVGDANYAPAVARFASEELGWLPKLAVVTDFITKEQKNVVEARFAGSESGVVPAVRFDTDASSVRKYLREVWEPSHNERYYDAFSPAFVFGSSYEKELAAELKAPLLPVSFPVTNRVVLNQCYAGYNGGLMLAADAMSLLVAGR